MFLANFPGDHDAYQSERTTRNNERGKKMEILGSTEGPAELESN